MFTEPDRDALLEVLVDRATADDAVAAAALVGSYARQTVDRWSDIDLALGLAVGAGVDAVAERWTAVLADLAPVADTLDIWSGPALYRVFLLDSSLQVDLSFWPSGTLAPVGDQAFVQLFGSAAAATPARPVHVGQIARWGWLYALHARSAISRGRPWQALQMIEGVRGQVVSLACLRHGLAASEGRGVDHLPAERLAELAASVPAGLDLVELSRALGEAVRLLLVELDHVDPEHARRLAQPVGLMGAGGAGRL